MPVKARGCGTVIMPQHVQCVIPVDVCQGHTALTFTHGVANIQQFTAYCITRVS